MRIVSHGPVGAERVGLLRDGLVLDLDEIDPAGRLPRQLPELLADPFLTELAGLVAKAPPRAGQPVEQLRLGQPVPRPGKIICVGLNYRGHADEQGLAYPERPLLFAKAPTSCCGCQDPIVLPDLDAQVDYEVELALVIGHRCRGLAAAQALSAVAGYMVANDVSARRWQRDDGQWFRAKSCDTFFPCGPALVTRDEITDHRQLRLCTRIGEEVLQDELVGDLIHDLGEILAWVSRDMTLEAGDVISTGTPAGVGAARTPPRFLRAGDTVRCSIAGLGELRNPVQAGSA